MNPSLDFLNFEIFVSLVFVIITLSFSKFLKLRLESDIMVASVRTAVQLTLIGYLLGWIFKTESLKINLFILFIMSLAASQAAVSRLKTKTCALFGLALLSLVLSVVPLGLLTFTFAFKNNSFQTAAVFIPFMGVLMGNTLSGISLSLIGLEKIKKESQLEVETFQSLGATFWEAHSRLYQELFRSSLTPLLNGMTVVGLVSLPGVMAGQILGGLDPVKAAQFQILLMTLMLLSSALGVLSVLVIHHFFFHPKWRIQALESSYCYLNPGDRHCLIGPSGSGKTRLMKSLVNLDDPEILKSRAPVLGSPNSTKSLALYVPQKPFFTPGTVIENLKLPFQFRKNSDRNFSEVRTSQLLESLGFSSDYLNKEALQLSGGEAQIIHLIRSLQLDPQYLLLDEPTASLDPQRTLMVENLLMGWSESSRGFLMTSHNPDQVRRLATHVIAL